ncbi:glycosyltransferase family 2 protein, partial [Paucibacter sp. TC2R-5]|uniref:glycosyltransferase family 2 protein n=1 Tax=Paucibacter sp. TC2R-5 TaxID=2893555 RepID=UPI0021E4A141
MDDAGRIYDREKIWTQAGGRQYEPRRACPLWGWYAQGSMFASAGEDRMTSHCLQSLKRCARLKTIHLPQKIMQNHIAVVIPCYQVKKHIVNVLSAIGPEVSSIYIVDDACTQGTADLVEDCNLDPRVRVIRHASNKGVGAAVVSGYRAALKDGAEVIVKIDGDGQMDPALIPLFVAPILNGQADYTKGNRFYDLTYISRMPRLRVLGNTALAFMSKLGSGYWNVFDSTNGYTAIHAKVAKRIALDKLSQRYFFE